MFKALTLPKLILLNQYVQQVVTRQEIDKWFLSLEENEKQSSVKEVWILATQAQVAEGDVLQAAKEAELKPTHTPVVMLLANKLPLYRRGYELANMKGSVLNQAFLLTLECFVLAERRRKEKEDMKNCNHWWHKDLSDERVIKEILENI